MTRQVQTQEAFKLALSMTLFYWLALWMNWDMPKYGGLAIALISLGTTGASLHKGVLRLVGTTAGLAVGMLGLALFAQDRWGTLLFLTSYLTIISYFMQTSRYSYAWYVAGFLAPLVWSATYGKVDHAFHYAV
ncbi:MAG: FUSC family protein, partial [Planctomycetota bacterium]